MTRVAFQKTGRRSTEWPDQPVSWIRPLLLIYSHISIPCEVNLLQLGKTPIEREQDVVAFATDVRQPELFDIFQHRSGVGRHEFQCRGEVYCVFRVYTEVVQAYVGDVGRFEKLEDGRDEARVGEFTQLKTLESRKFNHFEGR